MIHLYVIGISESGIPSSLGNPMIRPMPSRLLYQNSKNSKNSVLCKNEITQRLYYVLCRYLGKYAHHLPVLDSGLVDDVIQCDFGYPKFSGPLMPVRLIWKVLEPLPWHPCQACLASQRRKYKQNSYNERKVESSKCAWSKVQSQVHSMLYIIVPLSEDQRRKKMGSPGELENLQVLVKYHTDSNRRTKVP